jgi:hypothetical protein
VWDLFIYEFILYFIIFLSPFLFLFFLFYSKVLTSNSKLSLLISNFPGVKINTTVNITSTIFNIIIYYFHGYLFMGGINGFIKIPFPHFLSYVYLKVEIKFMFSIKCITTNSSSRDQPFC